MIKTIPKKNKCKKAKWLSEEDLQIAEKREVRRKGEKESYIHLNAEFQRIARRDKKAFLSEQYTEYTELYKKDLHDPDNHDGVIIHLEPDIPECEASGP